MSNFYRTHFNEDEGISLPNSECMNLVEVYRPIDINFNIQSQQDRRKKGFYRICDENVTTTLITMDLLFDMVSNQYNRDTLSEIKINWNSNEIIFNKRQNVYNDYLVGYRLSNSGDKEYFVTNFNLLPENTQFCYRNVIY